VKRSNLIEKINFYMRQHYSFSQTLKKIGVKQYNYYRMVRQEDQAIILKMRQHYHHQRRFTAIDKLMVDFLTPPKTTAEDLITSLVMGSQQNELSLPTSLVSSLYKNNSDSQDQNLTLPGSTQKSF
jgi:hypothetical protein